VKPPEEVASPSASVWGKFYLDRQVSRPLHQQPGSPKWSHAHDGMVLWKRMFFMNMETHDVI